MKKDEHTKTGQPTVLELEQKISELTNNWKRALADYQNLEKRVVEERQEWARLAARDVILKLLPAVDVFEQVQHHTSDQGIDLALKKLFVVLTSEGLEKIATVDKQFDPTLMECLDVVEGEVENRVVEELRSGYTLHGVVIRPAQVKVGKKKIDNKAQEGKE